MQTITIPASELRAVLTASAKNDVRVYLNGVYVEPCAKSKARLVATDGHRMMVAELPNAGDQPLIEPINIPREVLDKNLKGSNFVVLEINGECRLTFYGRKGPTVVVFKPLDGKYPDYRRVLPTFDTAPEALPWINFNLELLAGFHTAYDALRGKGGHSPVVLPNGERSPCTVVFPGFEHVVGVLMPVRDDGESKLSAREAIERFRAA